MFSLEQLITLQKQFIQLSDKFYASEIRPKVESLGGYNVAYLGNHPFLQEV
jgi:hypothetical protein